MDKRKWNDILACDNVDKYSVVWKIFTNTPVARHRDIDNRDIDGAVHWSSLFPNLRHEFERDGARFFSDSMAVGRMHRGINKPRFQYGMDSNNNLLCVFKPSKVT